MHIKQLVHHRRAAYVGAAAGIFLGLVLGSGCSAPSGQAKASARSSQTYTNPVYAGSMPDPSVVRWHGFYYAFGTTGSERLSDGRIFTTLRSRDMVHWETLGGALVPPSPKRRAQYWAPEMTVSEGKFYLYYCMGGTEPEKFELRVARYASQLSWFSTSIRGSGAATRLRVESLFPVACPRASIQGSSSCTWSSEITVHGSGASARASPAAAATSASSAASHTG